MRREYVWTHGLDGVQTGVIGHGFFDLWTDERLDQSEQLGFEIAADNPKVYLLGEDLELDYRGRRFYITELEDGRQGSTTTVKVEADALWYRLGERTVVGSLVLTEVSPTAGLERILRDTGWTSGPASGGGGGEFSLEQQDRSVLSLLRTWAKITGRALVFNTAERSVDLVDNRGADLGLAYRYGRNLLTARRRRRPPDLTVLYPFGADELSIAGINGGDAFVEDFTFYTDQGLDLATARELYTRSRVWSDSSFLRDVDLLPAAEARLALESQPVTSYELGVLDLSEHSTADEEARVADRVQVYDPSFSADLSATVVRVRRHNLEPWKSLVELATILDPIRDTSSATSRPSRSAEWHQFVGPTNAAYVIRNDGDYLTNRIALAFREGGRANFHLDLFAVGVDAGTMTVTVLDFENGQEVQRQAVDVPYTNGATVRASLDWAREELVGSYDWRVRVTTTASGGPSAAKGVNIAADTLDQAAFYIMAQGAIQETPTSPNMVRFDYTGANQSWIVPDGVVEATIRCAAASGGGGFSLEGLGCIVTATFPVVPGTVYTVEVGGHPVGATSAARAGGWPGGGDGGLNLSATYGFGGGGRSAMRVAGSLFAASLIVAPGGGGENASSASCIGGDGRFFVGENAFPADSTATGATQFAPGTGNGTAAQGQGGDCSQSEGGFDFPGGGGGDGWYGGGANDAPTTGSPGGPAGAGGSGWIDLASGFFDLLLEDGSNDGHGYIEVSWTSSD